jgi:hypothetical protein
VFVKAPSLVLFPAFYLFCWSYWIALVCVVALYVPEIDFASTSVGFGLVDLGGPVR